MNVNKPEKQKAADEEKKKLDSQFGINLAGNLNLKPKFRKIKNLASGNTSILFNGMRKKPLDARDVDLDLEELKLKVCLRKEIPYEELHLDEEKGKKNLQRRSFNDKKRMRMLKDLKVNYPQIAATLKNNSKILNNWIAYVVAAAHQGYLNKPEFFNTLVSLGIPNDLKLLADIFWIFDLNGDEVVDAREFSTISGMFRGYTLNDRIRSSPPSPVFMKLIDHENEGAVDAEKLKPVFDVVAKNTEVEGALNLELSDTEALTKDFIQTLASNPRQGVVE
jgi:Ca2+-binding EF-hand superfamily protein